MPMPSQGSLSNRCRSPSLVHRIGLKLSSVVCNLHAHVVLDELIELVHGGLDALGVVVAEMGGGPNLCPLAVLAAL